MSEKTALQVARARIGISLENVAVVTEIPFVRLHEIDEGAMPTSKEMITLCYALGMTEADFTGEVLTPQQEDQLFVDGLITLGLSPRQARHELRKRV